MFDFKVFMYYMTGGITFWLIQSLGFIAGLAFTILMSIIIVYYLSEKL
jgi:hypothetical protein